MKFQCSNRIPVRRIGSRRACRYRLQSLGHPGDTQDTAVFQFSAEQLTGAWLKQTGDLLIPAEEAAAYQLSVGDPVLMRVINPYGIQIDSEFHICGIFDTEDDLAQPLMLFEDAMRLFSLSVPNRQLLFCNELLTHATGLEENMQQVYPGAVFLYEWIAQNRTQQLTTKVQAPSVWILLLIYLFMGLWCLDAFLNYLSGAPQRVSSPKIHRLQQSADRPFC